ncbi:MAG: hypothetical protein HZY76_09350 [Anaerolineae bacterium]|nr:MAG: hypothetical protein HZY76_09350 [Anaerolineae bacterium]
MATQPPPIKTVTPRKTPTPTPTVVVAVRINELLAVPADTDWDGDGKVDTGDEWIELANLTSRASTSGAGTWTPAPTLAPIRFGGAHGLPPAVSWCCTAATAG